MPSEQLRFWLEVFGSFAGLVGLAAIALELLRARRADTRDYLLRIHRRLAEISKERLVVARFEFKDMDEFFLLWRNDENIAAYRAVYNFWELLIETTRSNPVDKTQIMRGFGEIFIVFYEKVANVSHEIQSEFGGHFFEPFDWFATEFKQNHPLGLETLESNKKLNEYVDKLYSQSN